MPSVIDLVKLMQSCQRNFDLSRPVPKRDQDYILQCATTMPTRNARPFYDITVITDTELTRHIYNDIAVDRQPDGSVGIDTDGNRCCDRRNGQTMAPLLLVFGVTPDYQVDGTQPPHRRKDITQSLAIASAGAALAAVELGYKTGYCKCFDEQLMTEFLIKHTHCQKPEPRLMLGIGHPNPGGYSRGESVLDGQVIWKAVEMGKTPVPIHYCK